MRRKSPITEGTSRTHVWLRTAAGLGATLPPVAAGPQKIRCWLLVYPVCQRVVGDVGLGADQEHETTFPYRTSVCVWVITVDPGFWPHSFASLLPYNLSLPN